MHADLVVVNITFPTALLIEYIWAAAQYKKNNFRFINTNKVEVKKQNGASCLSVYSIEQTGSLFAITAFL